MNEIIADKTAQIGFLSRCYCAFFEQRIQNQRQEKVLPFRALHSHFTSWAKYSETGTSDFKAKVEHKRYNCCMLPLSSRLHIPNRTFLVSFGGISGEFGRAMVLILARPNEPDMPPKRTKKVLLGIYRTQIQPKI